MLGQKRKDYRPSSECFLSGFTTVNTCVLFDCVGSKGSIGNRSLPALMGFVFVSADAEKQGDCPFDSSYISVIVPT